MNFGQILVNLPLPCYFIIPLVLATLSIFAGVILGKHVLKRNDGELKHTGSQGVSTVLGLLAFILAFTFGMAASKFETRRTLVLDQANAMRSTLLYAQLLPAPYNSQSRELLKQYIDYAASVAQANRAAIMQILPKADKVLNQLWDQVKVMSSIPNMPGFSAYSQSLNSFIQIHYKRIGVALEFKLPPIIWLVLYLVTICAMFIFGYDIGLNDGKFCLKVLVMVFVFSFVLYLIADLDRGAEGLMKISQEPIIEIQKALDVQK